jgi:hypothetical protein
LVKGFGLHIDSSPVINREASMDNWAFGTAIIVLGIGGSTASLLILSFVMSVLKKIFPYREEDEKKIK